MELAEPQRRLLVQPAFRRFVASSVLSQLGMQGTVIALGWLVYDKTHNPFDLGLIGLCQVAPIILLTLLVGNVADRFDRRRIVIACQLTGAATAAFLGVGVWQGWLTVPAIFCAVTVIGIAWAFEKPTVASLLPNLVPLSALQRAVATSTSFIQTAQIVGPALGGVLYGLDPVAPFALGALAYFIAAINMAGLPALQRLAMREKVTLSSVFAGVSFIRSRPVVLGTISLDMFAVLLGGVTALLPIFARDILMAGPWGLGLLRAAPAVGALSMSVVLARFPLQSGVGKTMFGAVTVFGIASIVFSLSGNIALSVVALLVVGAADTVSVVIRSSLVQLLTPDAMRGRVNAVNALFVGTSNQLGEFESGTLAGFVGPVAAGVIGGVGTLIVVVMWMRLFPALKAVKTLEG